MIQAQSGMRPIKAILKFSAPAIVVGFLIGATSIGHAQTDPLHAPRTLVEQGNLNQAAASLRNYLASNPKSADAHFLLGYVLFREKRAVDSLAEFTAGAQFRRPKADELKTVASDYVLLHDYADADKWFAQITLESPDDADAWYLLGRTKYNENGFQEAVSSFERALTLRPKYVEAENNLGLALRELNEGVRAKAAFQTAIDWQGEAAVDPQPFLNLGTMLVDESDFDHALTLLSKAGALSPDNPKIHEELGQVYEAQKRLPQAQTELEQAVKLAPGASGLHFKLGQIYRHEGMSEKAKDEFALCEKLNSAHSSAATPNPVLPDPSKSN